MLQTILVYSLLFFVMYVLCYYASKQNKWWAVVVALIIYSIIFGLRYGVGVDFFGYLNIYEKFRLSGGDILLREDFEEGFLFIIKQLGYRNIHYGWFFGIIAFLQIFLVFYSVKKDKYIYPFLVITFFLGCSWLNFANGLRQILVMCLFFVSLRYATNKQFIWYYLFLCLAVLFHTSAIVLFLIYPLLWFKEEWFSNIKLQMFLLVLSLCLMRFDIILYLVDYIERGAILLGYDSFFEKRYADRVLREHISLGIGFYINLFIDIICIIFSTEVKHWFRHRFIVYIYNLYFVGTLLFYIFINSAIIGRLNYYFYGFRFLFAAYVLYYLFYKRREFFYILLALFFLTYVAVLYRAESNTAMYLFNWQH